MPPKKGKGQKQDEHTFLLDKSLLRAFEGLSGVIDCMGGLIRFAMGLRPRVSLPALFL